jgi:hypothetical protein
MPCEAVSAGHGHAGVLCEAVAAGNGQAEMLCEAVAAGGRASRIGFVVTLADSW